MNFINMQDSDVLERNPLGKDYSGETSLSGLLGGLNKILVAVQGSIHSIVLRSALEATNKNQT